jgi:lipopolysaccharide/colanic/teichoic acid biosynthesis glycosyltransferase
MKRLDGALKRCFDLLISSSGIVFLSPMLLLIGLAIKAESPGSVLYRGLRVGMGGRWFSMLKFRTMIVGADMIGGPSTPDGDPRITPVGKYLRRYKLDELPQLLNVLKGEMSLVGPRPEVPQYAAMFTEEERRILTVRPGITDLATLWNADEGARLAGADDPERVYLEVIRPKKIQLQLEYVRCRNFWTDLRIIWQTILIITFRGRPKAVGTSRDAANRTTPLTRTT